MYEHTGNQQALEIAVRMMDWADVYTRSISDDEWQSVLLAEQGGMNEAAFNLYAITGQSKYRDLGYRFEHKKIFEPLAGRFITPTVRMHQEEWDGENYSLYSTRIEPKGPGALPAPTPKDEFSLGNVLGKEAGIFAEYTGLYGFIAKSRSRPSAERKTLRAGAANSNAITSMPCLKRLAQTMI